MKSNEVISVVEIPLLSGMEKSQPSLSMYRNKDIVKEGISLEENVQAILVKVEKPEGLHLHKNLPESSKPTHHTSHHQRHMKL